MVGVQLIAKRICILDHFKALWGFILTAAGRTCLSTYFFTLLSFLLVGLCHCDIV